MSHDKRRKLEKAFVKPFEAPQRVNLRTGFYMRATLALNQLNTKNFEKTLGVKEAYYENLISELFLGKFVKELYGDTTLTFKYSQTATGYPPRWEIFYPKYMINWITSTVQFKVQHFTLFSVFWNLVDLTVPEKVKLHASSHIPHFSFWVSCQALMTRCIDREFGLCILCHRFGSSVTDLSKQYPIEVGQCKPRKIKSGKLKIKYIFFYKDLCYFIPLSANHTKWSNTLKQFVDNLPTNCLSVFDHFVRLALKGLL